MADHSKPLTTSTYANFVTELDGRFDDLAVGLDPAVTTATNVPTNSIRWSSANNKWQKWNGSVWNDLSTTYAFTSVTTTGLNNTGNTTLGDSSADTITLNGTVQGGVVISGNTTADGLRITQTGTGNAFVVEDEANPDATPFVITSAGNVGVGTAPSTKLHIAGGVSTELRITTSGDLTTGGNSAFTRFGGSNSQTSGYVGFGGVANTLDIYNVLNGSVRIYTNNLERMSIDNSGNVGIGITPTAKLDVVNSNGRNARIGGLQIGGTSSTADAGNNLISSGAYWNGTNYTATATTAATTQLGNGILVFYTDSGLTAGSTFSASERMRIDSSGNVGIGGTPTSRFSILGGSLATTGDALNIATGLTTGRTGTFDANRLMAIHTWLDDRTIEISTGSTANLITGISLTGGNSTLFDGVMRFVTSGTERMRIDSSGNVLVGITSATSGGAKLQTVDGITFPATAVSSANANTLDDYEEGTFTPTYALSTPGTSSFTYNSQVGQYTKIGDMVYFTISIRTTGFTVGTGSGTVRIAGLPFTPSQQFSAAIGYSVGFAGDVPTGAESSSTNITLYYRTGANTGSIGLAPSDLSTGASNNFILLEGFYKV